MLRKVAAFFKPAPHAPRLPDGEVKRLYPRYRWSVLESTFIGYALFYITRNNLAVVAKDMGSALHYDYSMVGDILSVSAIAYGLGKFLMGALSDRSNPRRFMALGLILTAAVNFAFGGARNYPAHLFLWALNGFVQGMGWPPCGRSLGHWFSVGERGTVFSVWNIAHNVGGGIAGVIAAWAAGRWGWTGAFTVPGVIALISAGYLLLRLRDTPQSEGLPPIEEYRNDYPAEAKEDHERELTARELFVDNILANKKLWLFAMANIFVYVVRYSMLDWGPTYLRDVKHATLAGGGIGVFVLEFSGIPSTILMGWLSDRLGGRRGMVSMLCMIPIFFAFVGLRLNTAGNLYLDMVFLGVIGFFVYPPVMLLGVAALDMTSKKAVGAAAGFVGLWGYIGRTAQAKGLGWMAQNPAYGWDGVMYTIYGATIVSILLLACTWKIRPRG